VGGYWTRTQPAGPLQSIIDSALNPQWGNTATNVAAIRVPAGTTIYEGAAAAQGGLVGGGSQVFIPNVNPAWLVP
jgi:filamentous hemagglutinin